MIEARIDIKINEKLSDELMQKLDEGLDDLTDFIFRRSQDLCPVDESTLKESGHMDKTKPFSKTVYYEAVHAPWIEFGTKPHPVSEEGIEAITEWAERVLQLKYREARKAAEAIARRIRKKGGRPQPYLRPAFDDGVAEAERIIKNRMRTIKK